MALHSYARVWVHLVWGTLRREAMISKRAAVEISKYLSGYSEMKRIYMKLNFVNADHVHALIELPPNMCLEDVVQLLKGSSSHWVNEGDLVAGKFGWARGYGAFSVSASQLDEVSGYIARQEEHHKKKNYTDELRAFVERYGLKWYPEETVKTVSQDVAGGLTPG